LPKSERRRPLTKVFRDWMQSIRQYGPLLESIPLRPRMFTFVDIGSGKGRALLVASELPFAKIVGVELSHELNRIAQENIKRYRPSSQLCTTFFLHCMNAVEYTFGPEPLVLFLFSSEHSGQLGGVPEGNASRSLCCLC
jgi:tRNA G46 methylase TrmB